MFSDLQINENTISFTKLDTFNFAKFNKLCRQFEETDNMEVPAVAEDIHKKCLS